MQAHRKSKLKISNIWNWKKTKRLFYDYEVYKYRKNTAKHRKKLDIECNERCIMRKPCG